MATHIDFLQWLDVDVSLNILMCLDDPSDLIRASSVSRFWRKFVITNELCKQLCVRTFPQLASVSHIIELNCISEVSSGCSIEWGICERDHRVYASLFRALTSFPFRGCCDPEVPETLIYQLCAITEIDIQPFQEDLPSGAAIFSSKFVRFRMGYPKCASVVGRNFVISQECADDKFIWTYISQQFPMAQENRLQRFKLQEPAICFGGFLQIEFLGRIQTHEMDGLFYICVSHVQAIGRSLSPAFSVEMSEPSTLKYNANELNFILRSVSDGSLSSNLPPVSVLYDSYDNEPEPDYEPFYGFEEGHVDRHLVEMYENEAEPDDYEPFYGWYDPFTMN